LEVECARVSGECLEQIVKFLKKNIEDPLNEIPHPLPADSFREVRIYTRMPTMEPFSFFYFV
jgi:hypothetical protein